MVSFVTPVVPLFVPGSRPDRFAKADNSGADAVILDLEDAVAPGDKDRARDAVVGYAARLKSPVIVRINPVGTPWHEADIDAVRRFDGVSIMLSKAERAEDIADMARHITRNVSVIALVESAVGLANLPDILATPDVVAVAFGSVDFSLDLGCAHDRLTLLAARNELVWRSRAAGRAAPIDGVTTDLSSPEITEDDARHAMKMGFGGKMAIHPRQIEPIRVAFRPSDNEIIWARDIVGAASSGEAVQVNGEMVDRPVIERARRILRRAALV
ncbi:CoA ester lyase [Mesorhizobium sp. M7A.F.Ca.US.006.04.2.1]|uniref:HpcH/HpaI aldolase/citrate lyase family protein n=1 Tax=unclassified Mesorhizobium TaxID=325217 RepID=UPI000FCCBB51|nr:MULTISPECIES: CoA ester lyase [unclassified Mesorhizobium]RUX77064.1 CoA ester lyase [Mesorhizobium sp. M7A.F.Ca.US.005.03.1.1]RUY16878.1 CoA ester lyase [Mesorhizobium sp. M7A.F.Ca.US.005.03.2.1]RUY32279.1 CoA ester lyase [Mesorhizobium sp. M7A.F.Ca.US.001.04.2.1]RUY45213.1 CoA ester lyase [Mesorhizobium sp. M7A.F.Ca.US.001.04.1.1]RVA10706.1 CoA ester lyase [Mesorhizobium sp. M7A.F.Ca.US.002.01.1.1]